MSENGTNLPLGDTRQSLNIKVKTAKLLWLLFLKERVLWS